MQNNETGRMSEHLRQVAAAMGVTVEEPQLAKFAVYYEFLLETNQKVNLTRITEPLDVAVKHFGDSFFLLKPGLIPERARVADIGTGAGVPGIPLAIMRPDLRVVLVDSLRKRTVFLTEAVERLELPNVEVVWSRAEDLGHKPEYRERYDVVLARAVASLNVLTELCLPLVKKGGVFLALKGPRAQEELAQAQTAIALLGGGGATMLEAELPIQPELRTILQIQKRKPTPAKFPRKAGLPERMPL